ncbi:MAG TPA: protein kinase, partial [Pyrinomonadaceae bacterium]|nr:protein kinase [Pyrinomonadaceae bacterium]
MTPDRWRQIQDIFHAALDQPPAVRDSFLDQRCAGDQELRNSVAQLLAADAQSSVMVDRPIGSVAVGVLPAEETESLAGRVFNHYRIECEIGSGGMGRVYRAYDTLLNRPVALKLLPRSFTANAERVRRFQQEARVVSALNHPYIITIHEIGEIDGLRFIVTEFVDGQTLAQIIAHGERDLLTLLRIITQSTEALAAAHEAGIVHRDIKPDNIMVRHDGYVKILDFGIAKSSHETDFDDRADLTEGSSQVLTAPGLLLGTLKYMSPEQARSEIVDARSDIFSLGVVLCEALTCQAPFAGPTRGDLLVAITQQAPPRITDYVPEAPEQLQRIIDRALQKNRDERYQSMRELHRDLERLMDEISAGRDQLETLENAAAAPLRQRLAGQIKRFRFLTILALLVIAVAVALGLYRWRKSTSAAAFSFQQIRFTKLTFAGTTEEVAGSADGKYLVYSSHEPNGSWNLWLQQTGANNPVAIETTVNGPYLHPVFSPDGQYIYFKALDKDDPKNKSLYQVSTSGGAARKLFSDIYNGVAVSPDGSELAFTRVKPDRTGYQLVVRKLSTTEERVVLTETGLDHEVAWSPDGQTLTTVINEVGPDKQQATRIVSVGVRTGAIESWSNFRMRVIDDIAWSPDGTGVFVVASNSVAPTQIWYVPYRRGAAQ